MGQLASQGLGVLAIYFFLLFLLHFRLDFVQKKSKERIQRAASGPEEKKEKFAKMGASFKKKKKNY